MAGHANITRRNLLKAAPAVGSAALPVAALADEPETEIARLFREWNAVRIASNNVSEEVCEAGCERMETIEEKIVTIPSGSTADFATKVLVATMVGQMGMTELSAQAITAEALKFSGITFGLDTPEELHEQRTVEPESEIMRLFRKWELLDDANSLAATEAEVTERCCQMNEIVMRMASVPSHSPADFAAKIAAASCRGEVFDGAPQLALMIPEMLALVRADLRI